MTTFKTLCIIAGLAMATCAFAGDGTKDNPYTVAELNAQKVALNTSGATVWVKADLIGLGEDGKSTDNADTTVDGKTKKNMAGLFGDETGTFVAYSWQILGQLALEDLTNTKDLLISLTYGTAAHLSGNTEYPQYATNEEPTREHFSLEEVYGALSIDIKNGYHGYHVPSCYIIPQEIVAIKVSAGYTEGKGAYFNCNNEFDGASGTIVTPKNSALILLGNDGKHDLVLTTKYYNQKISNGNALNPGVQKGFYKKEGNFNLYFYRFINESERVGFERNSDNINEVTLSTKDEVYLSISAKEDYFYGKWNWETEDKKWISWNGKKYSDYHETGINAINAKISDDAVYDLNGRKIAQPTKGLYIQNGRKYIVK